MTILMGFGVFTMIPMWVQFTLAKSYSPLAHILESIKKTWLRGTNMGAGLPWSGVGIMDGLRNSDQNWQWIPFRYHLNFQPT